jgi:chromate transporter
LFTTATFIGYVLAGLPGATLATIGFSLASFVFVAVSNPLVPRMRASRWVGGLLDGVNVSSLALMAAVAWQLGRASLIDLPTALVALASFALLVLGGAAMGLLSRLLR